MAPHASRVGIEVLSYSPHETARLGTVQLLRRCTVYHDLLGMDFELIAEETTAPGVMPQARGWVRVVYRPDLKDRRADRFIALLTIRSRQNQTADEPLALELLLMAGIDYLVDCLVDVVGYRDHLIVVDRLAQNVRQGRIIAYRPNPSLVTTLEPLESIDVARSYIDRRLESCGTS